MRALVGLLLVLAAASAPSAQTVRDSVRMTLRSFWAPAPNPAPGDEGRCYVATQATWPNVLQDLLGSPDRTYGYSDYGRVATEGMYIPAGFGQVSPDVLPAGYLGHDAQIGGSYGSHEACASTLGLVAYMTSGAWTLLNAAPFRVTEWYATFNVPDGTPIALFEWEAGDGLAIDFDASFESEQSREIDVTVPGKKVPVASYAWTFGDGERGTGATPTHTYREPGEYVVRLVVTDDDGQTAAREETVTVEGVHLTTEIVSATDEVTQGDTVTVVGRVTNTGVEPLFGVRAARLFVYVPRLPDSLDVAGAQLWTFNLKATDAGGDVEVTRARLDPGESFEVTRDYVLETLPTYRNYSRGEAFRPVHLFLDWTELSDVSGETAQIPSVPVRQSCAGADPACATTHIRPPEVVLTVEGERAGATPVPSGGTVPAGVTYLPEAERASFYALENGNLGGCVSGCVTLRVTVTADGEPAANQTVRLFVPSVAESETVTARPHGNGLVAPTTQTGGAAAVDNGTFLDVRTDGDGRAHVFYFTPGVREPLAVEIRGETTYQGVKAADAYDLTVGPHPLPTASWAVDPVTAAYLRTLAVAIQTAGAGNSIGDLCEQGAGAIRAQAPLIGNAAIDDASSLRRDVTLYLSNVGINVTCGYLMEKLGTAIRGTEDLSDFTMQDVYQSVRRGTMADFFADLDGHSSEAKKFAQSHLFLYYLHELGLGGKLLGVVLPAPEPPPVFASFQGDFYEQSLGHLVDVLSGAPAGASYGIEVEFDEMSALNASAALNAPAAMLGTTMTFTPSGGAAATFRDRARYLYVPDVFLDTDPDPLTWLQEAVVGIGGAVPAAVGEVVVEGLSSLSESISGAVVQIGSGESSEINQVVSVNGTGRLAGDAGTLTLAAPTLFAYPEGTQIRVIARGEAGPPAAPIPSPTYRPREKVRLEWLPGAAVATHYDVEVAADSAFADVVVSREDLAELAVEVTTDDVARDRLYFWRVRAANAAGDGPWSAWQPLLLNDVPTADEPAPSAPTVVALEAPYPNPTRGRAEVVVELPEAAAVRLAVFDALGREVAVAHDGPLGAGRHALPVETGGLRTGLYVVRLEAGGEVLARRLTVVR